MKFIEPFPSPMLVTQPLLPEIEDLKQLLEVIWESRQLTNNGKLAQLLEKELAGFLKVKHLSLFNNGTIALQVACRALRLSGEVITTPFTFAATPHALTWCNITPVFCDIEEDTLNLDPQCIEESITSETTAILPVHVFGNPCRVEEIQDIAHRYGLKIIYDAAHTFGVEKGGRSIGSFGDISMFSFHATKVYNTIEGGALTFKDRHIKERADLLRNFGILNEDNVVEAGTNGKLNELQAAVGLLLLELADGEIKRRKELTELYGKLLEDIPGIRIQKPASDVKYNYPYFIIRVDSGEFGLSRDELYDKLKAYNVFARKYFYPLCSNFRCYRNLPPASGQHFPVAEKAAREVLALPLHGRLTDDEVEKICDIIRYLRMN